MKQLKKLLNERESYLLKLKREKEAALKNVPEGFLRITNHRNKPYYYHRASPKDPNGSYIPKDNIQLAHQLAQKDYDAKALRSITRELEAIKSYQSLSPKTKVEDIYESLNRERQKLILPVTEPENQYIQNWASVEYQGKYFDEHMPELYTAKGERVRSKSEIIIADLLNRESIPYRYECPLYLSGMGTVYPDFTALHVELRKEIYWEHLGMMDDPVYAEKAVQKIAAYEQNGIFPGDNLILTYETKQNPINQKLVLLMIRHYLQ